MKQFFQHYLVFCFTTIIVVAGSPVFAQTNDHKKDTVEQVDLNDVIRKLFHGSSSHIHPSDTSKKLIFSILPAVGYSPQTKIVGLVAANAIFYLGKNPDERLSTIVTSLSYTQNNQVILPVASNIWTKHNKFNFLGDWRITKYPQSTYGLGGHTSSDSADLISYDYFRFNETILRKISSNFYSGIGYTFNYHWNIKERGNPGGSESDYDKYGLTKKSVSSGITIDILYDGRDNSINPSKSFYANIVYTNNLKVLGSNSDGQSLIFDVRKYFQFPGRSRNVLAFWSYDWLTLKGHPPYLDLPATSWDPQTNVGRGYIQSRFRSTQLLYLESEYRFAISRNGLFGGVTFANFQAVADWPSGNFETVYPSIGLGLRVKLNKSSKTNISLDYAHGIGSSSGFTVNLGEVF